MINANPAIETIDKLISKQREVIDTLTELKEAISGKDEEVIYGNPDLLINSTNKRLFSIACTCSEKLKLDSFEFGGDVFLTRSSREFLDFMEW